MEKLGINWGLLIAQIFNVVLLVWLLTRFLYKPVLNMFNERTNRLGAKPANGVSFVPLTAIIAPGW